MGREPARKNPRPSARPDSPADRKRTAVPRPRCAGRVAKRHDGETQKQGKQTRGNVPAPAARGSLAVPQPVQGWRFLPPDVKLSPAHTLQGADVVAISYLVREARKRAGLTQAELARRAGVARSTVGRIEAGTQMPSTDLAERLVRAAGFEIRASLGEPDPETDSLFERTLRRTPAERLADVTRAVRFAQRGRRELAKNG